jgi:epimerase transport system membrane fusion protein
MTSEEKKYVYIGLLLSIIMAIVVIGWGLFVKIDTFVVAPGKIVVKSFKKPVEYDRLSTVNRVFIKEGDFVNKGDKLLELVNIDYLTDLKTLKNKYYSLLARKDRILSLLSGYKNIQFSEEFRKSSFPDKEKVMLEETKAFNLFNKALKSKLEVIDKKILSLKAKLNNVEAVKREKINLLNFYESEIKKEQKLVDLKLTSDERLRDLEAKVKQLSIDVENLNGQKEIILKDIEKAYSEKKEIVSSAKKQLEDSLNQISLELKQLKPKLKRINFYVQRTILKAPIDGQVIGLKVHSQGQVIKPGEPIMFIVPKKDEFFVISKIMPKDRDKVFVGQSVDLHIEAFPSATVGSISGTVTYVSDDTLIDEFTKREYYKVIIVFNKKGKEEIQNYGINVVAGMPTVAYIHAEKVTPIEYLLQPLILMLKGAFRAS